VDFNRFVLLAQVSGVEASEHTLDTYASCLRCLRSSAEGPRNPAPISIKDRPDTADLRPWYV